MESDVLGMLSNIHMQLADQRPRGTLDEDCLKLAGMSSTAVDFSKTGIAVNMNECPKYNRFRPDFMAPSPRLVNADQRSLELEEEDEEDDKAFDGINAEHRSYGYYESPKVLGQLYRATDERQFLSSMKEQHRGLVAPPDANSDSESSPLKNLLGYMKRQASDAEMSFSQHHELAVEIRAR